MTTSASQWDTAGSKVCFLLLPAASVQQVQAMKATALLSTDNRSCPSPSSPGQDTALKFHLLPYTEADRPKNVTHLSMQPLQTHPAGSWSIRALISLTAITQAKPTEPQLTDQRAWWHCQGQEQRTAALAVQKEKQDGVRREELGAFSTEVVVSGAEGRDADASLQMPGGTSHCPNKNSKFMLRWNFAPRQE